MANGAINFKNNSGNIVSFISGSGSDIIISGGTLNLSNMTGLTLGNLTMEGTVETASFAPSYLLTSSFNTYSGTTNTVIGTLQTSTASLNNRITSIEGVTGSYATTGSNIFKSSQTITGSLFVSENLVIAGSSSIQYISSSIVNIDDNIITVNAMNPSVRFGGLAVIDSGSSPQVSGSMLFDSINNQWLFVHQNQSSVTSSVLLMGPETYDNLGNESYLTLNRLPKGTGIEHLVNSNITDTGTKVSINSNTEVTGSLITTGAGTFSGNVGINGSPGTSFPLEAYINSSTTYTTSSRGNVFRVYNTNTSANVFAGIELGGAGTANDGLAGINGVVTGSGNGALTFYTRNSNTFLEKMRINSDGNVGIGMVSPDARLTVTSATAGGYGTGTPDISIGGNIGSNTTALQIYRTATTGGNIGIDAFRSGVGATSLLLNAANGGNVGIGTTGPATFLHVAGTSAKTLTGLFHTCIQDFTTMASGVGGGITFMGYKIAQSNQEAFAGIDGFKENGTSGNAAGSFRILTQPSSGAGLVEKMRITSGGVLKIGNGGTVDDGLNPGYKNVAISFNDAGNRGEIQAVQQTVLVYPLILNGAGGTVGIGTYSPASTTKLMVAGGIGFGNNTDGTANLSYGGRISAKSTNVQAGDGATLIHRGLGSVAYFILVSGLHSGNRFIDLVYGTGTVTINVLASSDFGTSTTRTYSMVSENLYVSLSGGAVWVVTTTGMGAMEA